VTTVLLIRHGRTKANANGVLAGWSEGVELDTVGRGQAEALAERLAKVPLSKLVTSPLQRCEQTAQAIAQAHKPKLSVERDDRLAECRYGDWTGRPLKRLAKDPLWQIVQDQPSAVHFPGDDSESLLAVSQRANECVNYWVTVGSAKQRDGAPMIALVSHGDVIKAILANALGMHLDMFQRIVIDPCSVSLVRYTSSRPYVIGMNLVGADLDSLARKPKRNKSAGAAVGGGKGERT
jgi:probable phosphomutase (TIGR03848 family)